MKKPILPDIVANWTLRDFQRFERWNAYVKKLEKYCPECGQAWIVHDGDGSCIQN